MSHPLPASSLDTYRVGLIRLLRWIDRTSEHLNRRSAEPGPLLVRKLTRTLFPLGGQIIAASHHAERDLARIVGVAVPPRPEAPTTLPALRARVANVLDRIERLGPADIDGDKVIVYGRHSRRMSAPDYLWHYAIPHFYFHLSVIYLTLRTNGVPLGKADFVLDVASSLPAQ